MVRLIAGDLSNEDPDRYRSIELGVKFPSSPRQRCDLVIGEPPAWAIEVKLFRILGDSGKLNDNMLMHLLSPYSAHRSALTDLTKLLVSGFECHVGIVIIGFEYSEWPLEPAISAFERLASAVAQLSHRSEEPFTGLTHVVQQTGCIYGWEILGTASVDTVVASHSNCV
jgi:hypothetical protein